jgi:restriction system protein
MGFFVFGDELVDLILENYAELSPKYRALLPLKQIYVADLA